MPNEVTEEQAVKIAEWLDFKSSMLGIEGGLSSPSFRKGSLSLTKKKDSAGFYSFAEWLFSPEGEVAMMDKLFSIDGFEDIIFDKYPDKVGCDICMDQRNKEYSSMALTRNQALQLAILEMLEKEEG